MALLEVADLRVRYGTVEAVRGVNLTVGEGEIVAIMGPNGAGKSSIFKAISRLVPYEGEVRLHGELVTGRPEDVVARGIGHVLEGRHIFGSMTVRENLLLARYGSHASDFAARMDAIIELMPIIGRNIDRLGGTLSGGQQQLLAIARGLLTAPEVLMMDEPSLGLAPVIVEQLGELFLRIRDEWKVAVLFSDQFARLVATTADRVYSLARGEIQRESSDFSEADGTAALSGYLGG